MKSTFVVDLDMSGESRPLMIRRELIELFERHGCKDVKVRLMFEGGTLGSLGEVVPPQPLGETP